MKMTHELPRVHICFGYGITFSVDLHVEVGTSEEELKRLAILHFKKHMPTTEQVLHVEHYLDNKKAWLEIEREKLR